MSICSRCGAQFSCALADGPGTAAPAPCWCTLLPPLAALPSAPGAACWCPDCLKRHIAAQPAAATPDSPSV